MATTTHIQQGGRYGRNLIRLLVGATAIALGGYAYGASSGNSSAPRASGGIQRTAARDARPFSYGWPVKPFHTQHPVRANFGDPRSVFAGAPTARGLMKSWCACSYHQGIDISAPDYTPVYPVRSGVVRTVTQEWVQVDSDGGVAFQYWHITSQVHVGDHVQEDETVLGRTFKGYQHVHLTQLQDGHAVNPLAPGNIGPYADNTVPAVGAITFRSGDTGPELLPEYVHGRVEIVASAKDTPAIPIPGQWHGVPVTPAKLTFHIVRLVPTRRLVVSELTAFDVTRTLPGSNMWQTYARGTRQNYVQIGVRRYWYQPGVYLFKLTRQSFDTRQLKDGVYELTVTACDTSGNHGSATQVFSVHNRAGWLKG